ncbi:transcriptional repressor TCF25-domain-containing protein [Exophiala viscosa]|uniref:Transcriptional repressor TCF25-domain-containing protein n=1 Tax=Exophiala viscosa TaxID=2486360 RepID=A0AAN6IH03_9EURO|nr:transcriptional repressor TCF25-domain-containing protein [Exophiala viscosa]KAI1629708.1 transcriptional repressor TCF25-domain-containing protein [Exophiala viscosa]
MSSRALRKLQREQELQRQVAAATKAYEEAEESEEDEPSQAPAISKPVNAFDMLEGVEDGDEESEPEQPQPNTHPSTSEPPAREDSRLASTPSSKSRKKKKKGKGKAKGKANTNESTRQNEGSGDEVDRALRELAAKNNKGKGAPTDSQDASTWERTATKLLAIEEKNLNPVNEMKSLFGNIALEGQEARSSPRNQRRRDQNQQGGVDLATALTGRYCVASKGKELGALAHRRNVFVQGREEWPLATSGGLSMENIPDPESFEKKYNIVHNNLYQETQAHFRMVVESMDPQRMIGLLSMYPYHIATLLQVSEIAKHQGDHAVSGDLIERALFSLGKSVHSSFPASLRNGIARVPFDKPANRELYLAIWRYIKNLEMRGTWRTAFEWAKILLQLNTLTDPYGVTLMIDQFALRGRQHSQLIALCSDDGYGPAWDFLSNIQISLALAYQKSGKPREARRQLAIAIHKYPYILSALATALDISPLPKSLWAKLPSTDAEKLHTELYVTRAKDLWNTPETISLLVEVAETLPHYSADIAAAPPAPKLEVSLEEARHVMLLEIPALIALLPRRFTNMRTSSSDVLPPPDSLSDFVARAPGENPWGDNTMQTIFNAAGATAGATGGLLQRIMNWFQTPAGPNDHSGVSEGEAAMRNLQDQLGGDIPPEMIEQLLQIHLDDAGQDLELPEGVTPAGLGMAGGWDYYQDAEQNNSSLTDNDEDDSMPELESIPGEEPTAAPSMPRNPHAAMVEEDEDEDDAHPLSVAAGRAVLRHADSDSEDEDTLPSLVPAPAAPATSSRPAQPAPQTSPPEDWSDPQRLQRWLLTTGLTDLQSKPETLALYVSRLKTLRKSQQDWVVSMVRQRAGASIEAKVWDALS